jgi:carboxymethylenebutenolidase
MEMTTRLFLTAAALLGLADFGLTQPPGAEQAKARLDSSPRHGELIDIQIAGEATPLKTWVVYPERKERAAAVIVIHEIFGLSDWIRSVADQLAQDGFIALAPDLLSGRGPAGGGTDSFASRDDVVQQIRGLGADEVRAKLDAVRAYAIALPAASGKSATIGFCWGGSTSFAYAAAQPELQAAVVYYGTGPDAGQLGSIQAPVLGLYGADDARVTTTVEPTAAAMKKLGKPSEFEIYPGAGHGFLRDQSGREGANLTAAESAWPRTLAFLRAHTGG